MLGVLRRHFTPLCRPTSQLARAFSAVNADKIRNVAIIAHVDHGKTTLVDCLLKQSGALDITHETHRVMDSNTLERERGITILAKCTSINYKDHRINIVDTPGHADFGGEVERALTMVDGVVLVVDATEGPMAQTKFVLSKALQRKLRPIVVQNKVDRESARCDEVDCEILDLFMSLNADDNQLNFRTIYASARDGWATTEIPDGKAKVKDMSCLFEAIINGIPGPVVREGPFSLLVNSVEPNAYVGKCLLGKIESGKVSVGDKIKSMSPSGIVEEENRVTRMFLRRGLEQVDITEATAGEIISLAGIQRATVNYTIGAPEVVQSLETIPVDPPTVTMTFMANNSPIAGSEGKSMTRLSLYERLKQECENNVSLKLEILGDDSDAFKVSARGELQLGILIETIRREGFELAVSPPQVVFKIDNHGNKEEPIEEVTVDCDQEHSGVVIEKLSKRKGELLKMSDGTEGKVRLVFKLPTRGLIGYASELKNDTKGSGVLNHCFSRYEPYKGAVESSRRGCLISMADGVATGFSLSDLESRGELFIAPGARVYAGMVIGECSRSLDMEVNPCKAKVLTNIRNTVKEEFYRLPPPKHMNLEEYISYMAEDEMLEVTTKSLRLRKWDLDANSRKKKSQSKRATL